MLPLFFCLYPTLDNTSKGEGSKAVAKNASKFRESIHIFMLPPCDYLAYSSATPIMPLAEMRGAILLA